MVAIVPLLFIPPHDSWTPDASLRIRTEIARGCAPKSWLQTGWDIDIRRIEPKFLVQMTRKRLYTNRLAIVVTAKNNIDVRFSHRVIPLVAGLTGDERIRARGDGFVQKCHTKPAAYGNDARRGIALHAVARAAAVLRAVRR
jgi:hypothetical protein